MAGAGWEWGEASGEVRLGIEGRGCGKAGIPWGCSGGLGLALGIGYWICLFSFFLFPCVCLSVGIFLHIPAHCRNRSLCRLPIYLSIYLAILQLSIYYQTPSSPIPPHSSPLLFPSFFPPSTPLTLTGPLTSSTPTSTPSTSPR